MIAVAIESIGKRYGDTVALDNVSLSIPQGGFFRLAGAERRGQNDSHRHFERACKSGFGTAKIMGSDVETDRPRGQRKIGVVPQELILRSVF